MSSLTVEQIYLYPLENARNHHTDTYELVHDEENPIPVLRRGQKFTLALRFSDRAYDKTKDIIRLIFSFGPDPITIKGTQGVVTVDPTKKYADTGKLWNVGLLALMENTLTVEIYSPPDCPVGIWSLKVETNTQKSSEPDKIQNYENDLYLLFNPWNCDDLVCMPEKRLLDEYILTDVGKIWVGPYGSSRGREWVFGQFDACILPAAMLMFERSGLPSTSRGDPVKVVRVISKLVNSNDDDGILIGKWDGEYDDGTAPAAWSGSIEILQKFLDTQEPVGYGQCWVFAGVVTTICRALGIPSRVVSNLVSGHDSNSTITIDKYFDEKNVELEDYNTDSIWNFHVWNDVWMTRPDLPEGYGGWQAVDATPQETSDSVYQCGPASVYAIKNGAIGCNYDVPFMIAAVNADIMRWKRNPECDLGYSKISCNKYHIGRVILTKKPFMYDPNGDRDREDVTLQYKSKEGSKAERLSLLNAVRSSHIGKVIYELPDAELGDVEFDLEELDLINIGDDFNLIVKMKNKSNEIRHIEALLSANSVFYTGIIHNSIKKAELKYSLAPNSSEKMKLVIRSDEYLDKLVEYCNIKIFAIANVTETSQTWADEDDFQVIKPKIKIKVPSSVPIRTPTVITLRFVNPLKKTLTNCQFNISGPSIIRSQVMMHPDVKPGAKVKVTTEIMLTSVGDKKLVATFSSKELLDITGSAKIEVFDDNEE
ncbi:hemocyte protein-glutamine gamma-glutamyltransferase-like [Agrilus planipennis]|uniref:protein-glutamine gamma-glutamyltransferase n=1 Tax=Agrilus planipennis TaxID=224129 RepID=A0A1W4WI76_AGRPL|nr:hemocyte protein-glutamine gamma-glutamyltransferase-like [Agrilus planipennis]XP_018323651.1 hemocyte protein-glutamine gamma-glutamyltransferase-like [Agrilus planipennis]